MSLYECGYNFHIFLLRASEIERGTHFAHRWSTGVLISP